MHEQIVQTHKPNRFLTPPASACLSFAPSFANNDVSTQCGTLLDFSDLSPTNEWNESIEGKYEQIDSLIREILLLVDLLFADHGVARALPGEAA